MNPEDHSTLDSRLGFDAVEVQISILRLIIRELEKRIERFNSTECAMDPELYARTMATLAEERDQLNKYRTQYPEFFV